MATMVAVYKAFGCVGICCASCYTAKHKACDCICGGANHGKGLEQARANTAAGIGLAADDLARFATAHGFACEDVVAIDRLKFVDSRVAFKEAWMALHQMRLPGI